MQLIQPIDLKQFDLTPAAAEFLKSFATSSAELDAHDTKFAELGKPPADDPQSDWKTYLNEPLDSAGGALAAELGNTQDRFSPISAAQQQTGEQLLSNLDRETPAEAYQPLPAELRPPPELGGFRSEPVAGPPRLGGPSEVNPEPLQPSNPQFIPQVFLRNLSKPGLNTFHFGDSFEIELQGNPNSNVTARGSHEDVPFSTVAFGVTDAQGFWKLDGKMTAAELGFWLEEWYIAGRKAEPTLLFSVIR